MIDAWDQVPSLAHLSQASVELDSAAQDVLKAACRYGHATKVYIIALHLLQSKMQMTCAFIFIWVIG